MGKIMRLSIVIHGSIVLLAFLYFIIRGVASWKQGYTWEEMDWNQRGSTSIADFLPPVILENEKLKYSVFKDTITSIPSRLISRAPLR